MNSKPLIRIGITCGDPQGIGPEVVLKALTQWQGSTNCEIRWILYGPKEALMAWAAAWGISEVWKDNVFEWKDFPWNYAETHWGCAEAHAGRWVDSMLTEAMNDLKKGVSQGLVTAPIFKRSLQLANAPFTDHTTRLQAVFGVPTVMSMITPRMKVAFVTSHIPLKDVPAVLNRELLQMTVEIAERELRERFSLREPRIGICGLNPHAGEEGLLGREELDVIIPVVEDFKARGFPIQGPIPPETAFRILFEGQYDLCVALYHDQGMIPVKLIAFGETVNYTMGLPVVRTSPDHGAAPDIAGKNCAHPNGMLAAMNLAVRLCLNQTSPTAQ